MSEASQASDNLQRLLRIMADLRDPQRGCAWDRQQTFATIAPYTIEEAYEVADAITEGDLAALRDELGDLLFQVVFHARMAEEAGAFDFDSVAGAIADKMIRRHPHVFQQPDGRDTEAQTRSWEQIKAQERAAGGAPRTLDGVPAALPGLTRAVKLQNRAARVGFDWPDVTPVYDKLAEELEELREAAESGDPRRVEEEAGDLLFVVANLLRHHRVDPESALRVANSKFERRFRAIEDALAAEGVAPAEAGLERMDAIWRAVKAGEKAGQPEQAEEEQESA